MLTDGSGVSDELRAAEREVDLSYKGSPLMSMSRSQAAWLILAECEEIHMRLWSNDATTVHDIHATADTTINLAKWPMRWLWKECDPSDALHRRYDRDLYEASKTLASLGERYLDYEVVFTYASEGLLTLELTDRRIVPTGPLRSDTRWDAYDRLVDGTEKSFGDSLEAQFFETVSDLMPAIAGAVRVNKNRFQYEYDESTMDKALSLAESTLDDQFRLPLSWKLTRYQLGDYKVVLQFIVALSWIHFCARRVAASRGCFGYTNSLVEVEKAKMVGRVCDRLGQDRRMVRYVLQDLTFGERGMNNPDIALQPLVPLGPQKLAWAPALLTSSAVERNLMVLMNRFPEGKRAYASLSEQREELMRRTIRRGLKKLGFRFWSGNVPNWGDASEVDLAIIDDETRCCIILELKSFIAPADPREVFQKAREIERGVGQVERRKEMLGSKRKELNSALCISDNFTIQFAVASESAVACGVPRVGDVPVVRSFHLISRIQSDGQLRDVCRWLRSFSFLPKNRIDYREVSLDVSIGGWTLEWYGLRLMRDNYN